MFMKLTQRVDIYQILHTAFECADPKGAKKTDNLTVFFALLGSVCVKAENKMLVKFSPGLVVQA